MDQILKQIEEIGLVPVVKIDRAEDAVALGQALCDGGLPCAEVTFRTAAAKEAISLMVKEFPNMLIGAGTVLTTEQADDAMEAGAKFLVSPGLNPKVVSYCIEKGYPILPGTANPSDVEAALELGLTTVKFFPAEAAGGLNMIKSMAAPYTSVRFMPTGGINAGNVRQYLDFPKIIACGGSWMVGADLIASGNFKEITRLTRQAVETMLGLKIEKMMLPKGSEAAFFSGLEVSEEETGKLIVSTCDSKRTKAYLTRMGVAFTEEDGKLILDEANTVIVAR